MTDKTTKVLSVIIQQELQRTYYHDVFKSAMVYQ